MTKKGDATAAVCHATSNQQEVNLEKAVENALRPTLAQIGTYLTQNSDLYPEKMNGKTVNYDQPFAFAVEVPIQQASKPNQVNKV